jgi:putative membrane protein
MMGWDWADSSGAGWWAMGLGMLLFVIVVAAVVGLVVWLVNRSSVGPHMDRGSSAEDVLRHRFASGEIDGDEYQKRLAVLRR